MPSNKITEQPTTTAQPEYLLVNLGGDVNQLTWDGFVALVNSLAVPLSHLDTDGTLAANSDSRIASQKAIKTYVTSALAALVASSPSTLDTLNELAAALGNDANFATTLATALGLKAPLASPALTGNPTAPTQSAGNNSTRLATTAYVDTADAAKAPLDSPALTGNPTAPTQSAGNNSTRLATTAYVDTAASVKAPLNSPALTGTPTAPTASGGTNTTQLATTAFVQAAVAALINGAPGALDTLKELADAINDDASFAASVTSALTGKVSTSRQVLAAGLATGGGALSADQTITVPAASQAEAEEGTNNTKAMTPLRVAQAIAALGGGGSGGGANGLSDFAFIKSDGNNGTAVMGDPTHPYADIQTPYDAGKRKFWFLDLVFVSLYVTYAGDEEITIYGNNRNTCGMVGNISFINSADLQLNGNGRTMVRIGTLTCALSAAASGGNNGGDNSNGENGLAGNPGPYVEVRGISLTGAVNTAQAGGAGGIGGPGQEGGYSGGTGGIGGAGGTGGLIRLMDCYLGEGGAIASGGAGGEGGKGGGAYDGSVGSGGVGGLSGAGGGVQLWNTECHPDESPGLITAPQGGGGAGGYDGSNSNQQAAGNPTTDGQIHINNSEIGTLGSYQSSVCRIRRSWVNGAFVPDSTL